MKAQYTLCVLVLSLVLSPSDAAAPKIYNGNNAIQYKFSFMAGIKNNYQPIIGVASTDKFFCGASLVRQNAILTAAHCVAGRSHGDIYAVLGDHTQSMNEGREVRVEFKQIIKHPAYFDNGSTIKNDIAILVLDDTSADKLASINHRWIQPIKLAPERDLSAQLQNGASITISGWGGTHHGKVANTLQKLDYYVVSESRCKGYWNHAIKYVENGAICTGLQSGQGTGQEHAWKGDSGGPLFTEVNGAYTQLALVSWGTSDPTATTAYDVNTNVPHYYEWLMGSLPPYVPSKEEEEEEEEEEEKEEAHKGCVQTGWCIIC